MKKKVLFSFIQSRAGIYKTSGIIAPGKPNSNFSIRNFYFEVQRVLAKVEKILESQEKGWNNVWDVVIVAAAPSDKWKEVQEIVNKQYSKQVLSAFGPDDKRPIRMFTNVVNLPQGARFEMQIQFD